MAKAKTGTKKALAGGRMADAFDKCKTKSYQRHAVFLRGGSGFARSWQEVISDILATCKLPLELDESAEIEVWPADDRDWALAIDQLKSFSQCVLFHLRKSNGIPDDVMLRSHRLVEMSLDRVRTEIGELHGEPNERTSDVRMRVSEALRQLQDETFMRTKYAKALQVVARCFLPEDGVSRWYASEDDEDDVWTEFRCREHLAEWLSAVDPAFGNLETEKVKKMFPAPLPSGAKNSRKSRLEPLGLLAKLTVMVGAFGVAKVNGSEPYSAEFLRAVKTVKSSIASSLIPVNGDDQSRRVKGKSHAPGARKVLDFP